MATERQLSAVLSEFARTMVTDFPIQGILDRLVQRIVEILPVTGAGVTLITPKTSPRYVAASDQSALRYEQLQSELDEGPCLAAYRTGEAVAVADLRTDPRFAVFGPRATEAGLVAVFTFPLRQGETQLGALDLYRDEPGLLGDDDMATAQTLADVTAAYLANAQGRADLLASSDRLRQSERLESLGQLAGGIAHDFNNVLAVIINYAEFVIDQTEDPQILADATQIQTAAERAAALTRQLLTFARRETVQLVSIDLNSVVAELETLLSRTLGEHMKLIIRPGSDVPAVWADRGQMDQVLVNLAVNARDAMANGGSLTVETRRAELDADFTRNHPHINPGAYAELTVSDTGIGMSQDVVAHIFEPFFTTKPPGEGTGLGLATVYGIVRTAGGTISVYSEVDVGTTIRVYIPANATPVAAAQRVAVASTPQGHGEMVLVVEDETALLEVTARILRLNGYQVLEASTSQQALSWAADHDFQVLLTDVVMPGMSGRDLATRILAERPGTFVVHMSGYGAGVLGPRLSLDDHINLIQKPFTRLALLNKMRDVLAS
jgi:hypothetical protein